MPRGARLGRQEIHALKALVTLAQEVDRWRSVTALAEQQDLPAPMLEQILLRLRRAGLLEARRGRQGGYRLSLQPQAISLARVLRALEANTARAGDATAAGGPSRLSPTIPHRPDGARATGESAGRATGGVAEESDGSTNDSRNDSRQVRSNNCNDDSSNESRDESNSSNDSLEESSNNCNDDSHNESGEKSGNNSSDKSSADPLPPQRAAARQVAAALELRLQRALERELNQISLADLLFDLRSSQASLEDDGGLMLP